MIIKKVNNSILPINIKRDRNHLPDTGIELKVYEGPTSPIPGPTFPSVAATDPIAVIKSTPINDIMIDPIEKITTYSIIKANIFETTSLGTFLLLNFKVKTPD